MTIIPRKDEFIWIDEQYYDVINVVHSIGKIQSIYIIVNQLTDKPFIKNVKIGENQ